MKLIDNWASHLWKAWSIRLAMIAGVIGAYFAAYPAELQKLIDVVPEQWRGPASVLVGLLIFSTATGTRLVSQAPKGDE